MRIISKGDNREECNSCGTLYEYDIKDLRPIGMNTFEIQCPVCGQKVYIISKVTLDTVTPPIEVKGEENDV